MSLCLEVACSCAGLLGPVALLGISTVRRGGGIKRFTREQLTVLTGRGGQTAASWVFFCFVLMCVQGPTWIQLKGCLFHQELPRETFKLVMFLIGTSGDKQGISVRWVGYMQSGRRPESFQQQFHNDAKLDTDHPYSCIWVCIWECVAFKTVRIPVLTFSTVMFLWSKAANRN